MEAGAGGIARELTTDRDFKRFEPFCRILVHGAEGFHRATWQSLALASRPRGEILPASVEFSAMRCVIAAANASFAGANEQHVL